MTDHQTQKGEDRRKEISGQLRTGNPTGSHTQFAVSGRTRKPRYIAWRVTFLCGHDWSNEHPIPRHDMSKPPIKCPACGCDELVAARGFTR